MKLNFEWNEYIYHSNLPIEPQMKDETFYNL